MYQPVKTFTSEGPDTRKWIGRIIMAVILGEAIWSLIVSVMNNLVVPWLGDVMGQSSGLPTSFTQRPYNYPDLFVSILEVCIAGTVAVILNYFFQRQSAGRVRPVKSPVPIAPVDLAAPAAPVSVVPAGPGPVVSPTPPARPLAVAPPAPPIANSVAAKPLPAAPKAEPPKLKKPKEVYYNIVGEPMPSDED